MVTARAIAAHAEDLRLSDAHRALEQAIETAAEAIRLDTADGRLADLIHTELFGLKQRLGPTIERLARKEAEAEALREAESAEHDRAYAEYDAANPVRIPNRGAA